MAKNQKTAVETTPATENNANVTNVTKPETAQPAPKVYTSEKLTALQAEYAEKRNLAMSFEAGTPEEEEASLAQFAVKQAIKSEIQRLKNEEAEAILTEKRNQRLAIIDELLNAHDANVSDATEANGEALKTVREKLSNILLGTVSRGTPAKTTGDKPAGGGNASEGRKKVVDFYLANRATMSDSDIRKQAEADGLAPKSTIWHAINDFKNAQKAGA